MTDWPQLFSEAKRQSVFLRCAGIFWGCGYGLYAFGRLADQHRLAPRSARSSSSRTGFTPEKPGAP